MALPHPAEADPSTDVTGWRDGVLARAGDGARFAGLYGSGDREGVVLTALLVDTGGLRAPRVLLRPGRGGRLEYPSLTPQVPAAFWYERAMHDLSGVVAAGHPRLDPLLLAVDGGARPRPGGGAVSGLEVAQPDTPVDIAGDGLFTLPFGPVRSGVMETIEFLLETPGEDIPHLNIRPHYKHRGVAKAFEGRSIADGVLVAERVEGVSSVAHALAYCHAIEALAGVTVSGRAGLLRVVYAELERIANHLDVTMRLADAAGLAVATARFGYHKETVMRLVSAMCGNRFGRGLVIPGGVAAAPALDGDEIASRVAAIRSAVASDVAALQRSASFLDRLRGTGPLTAGMARRHGALGPIGRGSGFDDDHRTNPARSYDGYGLLPRPAPPDAEAGDALARARVRWHEIDTAAALIGTALEILDGHAGEPLARAVRPGDGFATGWAEAAQGEVLYAVDLTGHRIARCLARSASFHNLVLFHDVFAADIYTDFPFIEASFGLSYAGVAM